MLLAAACTGSTTTELGADEPPGVTPPPAGISPEPDQADEPATGPDGERVVPPLVIPPTAPGSDEAYDELIDELERLVTDEQRAAGVPWPDTRNADPVAAYRSCARFQGWMAENNPTPSLVEAYTAPASPERQFDLEIFGFQSSLDLLSTPNDPPYSMRVVGVVHPAATDITDALLAMVPEGSVAVVYYDSVGRSSLVTPDGQVYSTDRGWTDVGPWVSIMAPTDVGWQVWWDELTDTPPPDLDQGRGSPTVEPPRRDL